MSLDKQFKGYIYRSISQGFSKCFFPTQPACKKPAIKAHSIQNQGVLRELAEDGHVIILQVTQDLDDAPQVEFKRVGRNKATTFSGLCNEHDTSLFRPIDCQPFDINKEEHLFLLSYRSVLRELHAQCCTAKMVQEIYTKGIKLGHFDENDDNDFMMSATIGLVEAWSFHNYSCIWAEAYVSHDFERIKHRVMTIPSMKATFAVSSVYSIVDNMEVAENRTVPDCIAFNVFPHEDKVVAVWSYPDIQHESFATYLDGLFLTNNEYRKYMLSRLVLRHCENFVLAPSFYESLSDQQIESIKRYYLINVPVGTVDYEEENLFLF